MNRELDAFTHSASHDLRGPLNRISGFSNILLEDYASQLDPQGKDYLQRISNSSRQMGELIDDLLKLSKVSQHQISHDPVEPATRFGLSGFGQARRIIAPAVGGLILQKHGSV